MGPDSCQPDESILSQIRVVGIKREIAEVLGQEMHGHESTEMSVDIAEAYWLNVLSYEKAEWTTQAEILGEQGIDLREPSAIPNGQIHDVLWRLIRELESRGTYLESTDHLSDRELYTFLVSQGLREQVKAVSPETGWSHHLSPIGSGSDEDMLIYHRYYTSTKMRKSWMVDFPDYKMPKREKRPYDRDRRLAKWAPPMLEFPVHNGAISE